MNRERINMQARDRDLESGLTLIELMIATVLTGLAATFVFWIGARTSLAYRTQSSVAEVQQILRAAGDLITYDLRQAGSMVTKYRSVPTGLTTDVYAVEVVNAAGTDQDDTIMLTYGNSSYYAPVTTTSPAFPTTETEVSDLSSFQVGDIALAVRVDNPLKGRGCVLKITSITPSGPNFRLAHASGGAGGPWNEPGNNQCDHLAAVWNDGYTVLTEYAPKKYRLRPNDTRGVLQVSSSGGVIAGDWAALAEGVVDLQVAIRVYQKNDTVDLDGDGDPTKDWYSSTDMETILSGSDTELLRVKLSLVAKTHHQVNGVVVDKTPDLTSIANPANNNIGDHAGTALPVEDLTSRYYGEHIYRSASILVDARNLGIGI